MKRLLLVLSISIFSQSLFASQEILFNTEEKREVVDLFTDPALPLWKQVTELYELCYKNADAQTALTEILKLKDEGVLFYDPQTDDFQDAEIKGNTILITVYNEKMLDDGIDPEEAYQTHEIEVCNF